MFFLCFLSHATPPSPLESFMRPPVSVPLPETGLVPSPEALIFGQGILTWAARETDDGAGDVG